MYLTSLDRDFDRMMRRAFGTSGPGGSFSGGLGTALAMDTLRREGEVVLRFDVPGVDPEQIDVTVDHGVLTVAATREETSETSEGTEPVVRERYFGKVTRSVRLSDNLDTEAIEADNVNGVLEIRIPVREEAKPRKITIGGKKELGR
ncbi:MAG TPA: Hsp20/alpha crystallin family protein [Trebonia sp.]|jgi:HSP20 family protein